MVAKGKFPFLLLESSLLERPVPGIQTLHHTQVSDKNISSMDNFTAVSYINKMGGGGVPIPRVVTYGFLQRISQVIVTNVVADFHSRCFTENTEWALNTDVFVNIVHAFFLPEIYLFVFALNFMLFLRLASFHVSWQR